MKAEDLLQAMNDIDTKYVAEAQPWTAPVKKLHHPVWAAAAAVMLCLGLGAGAAVMLHSPAVQPGAEGGVTTELSSSQEAGGASVTLEFEHLAAGEEKIAPFAGTYGPAYAEASAAGEDGGIFGGGYSEIFLTREQLEAIWQGDALPWDGIGLENVTLDATAAFQDGELIQVYIEAPDCFTIQLVSRAYAEANAADWARQVEESFASANNQAEGTPVVAVSYDVTTLIDGKEVPQTDAQARFALGEAIATVTASSSEMAFPTPGEAQAFVEQVVGQSLNTGVVLSGLSAPQDGTDTALEFAQWDEAEYETLFREWADGYGADVIEPQVTKPDGSYRTQDLPLEQVKALWGGEFPWVNGHDSFQNPRAYTYHTEEGEPVYAVIEIGGGDVGFTVTILPQYPQGEWGEALAAVLAQANEEINGVPVLTSGTQLSTAAYTKYEALFQPQSSDSVIHVEAHAGDTQSDFTPGEAQAFVEQVVEGTLTGGIDLAVLQP